MPGLVDLDLYPRGIWHSETLASTSEDVFTSDGVHQVSQCVLHNSDSSIRAVTFESNDGNTLYFTIELGVDETVVVPAFEIAAAAAGIGGLTLTPSSGSLVKATVFYKTTKYDSTQYVA